MKIGAKIGGKGERAAISFGDAVIEFEPEELVELMQLLTKTFYGLRANLTEPQPDGMDHLHTVIPTDYLEVALHPDRSLDLLIRGIGGERLQIVLAPNQASLIAEILVMKERPTMVM